MSQSIQSPPAQQNTKVLIITALITAMTTIGVSFVGVVPQLRGNDAGTINELKQQLERVARAAAIPPPPAATVPPGKKKTIEGTVLSEDGKQRMSNVDVYLVPADGPRLMSQTDPNGKFILSDIPSGVYSIIVLGSNGKGTKTYLVESEQEVKVPGTLIKYSIRDKGDR